MFAGPTPRSTPIFVEGVKLLETRQPETLRSQLPQTSSPLLRIVERWWWVYALLSFVVTVLATRFDWYQVDGDAVGYMDISDYILQRRWDLVVNGYWHPLYPAVLALGQRLFHTTRMTELAAFYWMSDGIFVLELLATIALVSSLCSLRSRLAGASQFLLGEPALQLFALSLVAIAAQRELSPGKIRPDALLQALLLFGVASMARYLATGRLRYAAVMGVSLGFGYLTKSFALAFTMACVVALIPSCLFLGRQSLAKTAAAAVAVVVCFGAIAGPYIGALSRQHGRLDMGDSGALNYAWFIGNTEKLHLEPWMTDRFGSSTVHLKHPETQLLADPPVYSFQAHPGGTYPPWFDPSYFNEGVVAHPNLLRGIPQMGRNFVLAMRYIFDHLEAPVVLVIFALCGMPLVGRWRTRLFALPILAAGLAVWIIYGLVNVEQRYVTVGYLLLIIAVFASLPLSRELLDESEARSMHHDARTFVSAGPSSLAAAVLLTLALLTTAASVETLLMSRRIQSLMQYPGGWYNSDFFPAASALRRLGLPTNAAIGCIGRSACLIDTYTARLAGVHIVSEIFAGGEDVQSFMAGKGPEKMQAAVDAVHRDGAQLILGSFDFGSTSPIPPQWHRLGNSSFFYFDLRNASAAAAVPGPSANALDAKEAATLQQLERPKEFAKR